MVNVTGHQAKIPRSKKGAFQLSPGRSYEPMRRLSLLRVVHTLNNNGRNDRLLSKLTLKVRRSGHRQLNSLI